jgi:hypothetical protein
MVAVPEQKNSSASTEYTDLDSAASTRENQIDTATRPVTSLTN